MKLARCARSDSHSVRALRAVKSHPCGAGLHSNGRGAAPVLDCWFSGGADSHTMQNGSAHCAQTQMRRVRVKYAGAGPHPSGIFPACPWKICVAASRLPCLLCLYAGGANTGECFSFLSCSWNVCVARFACVPCADVSLHDEEDPHTIKMFIVVCGSASVFATREQRGAAVRYDAKPCGNTGTRLARARRSSPGSSCGPLFICAAFFVSAPRPRAGMASGH